MKQLQMHILLEYSRQQPMLQFCNVKIHVGKVHSITLGNNIAYLFSGFRLIKLELEFQLVKKVYKKIT